jgi:hypothetical protein
LARGDFPRTPYEYGAFMSNVQVLCSLPKSCAEKRHDTNFGASIF